MKNDFLEYYINEKTRYERLQETIFKSNLTEQEFAEKAGLNKSHISGIITGTTTLGEQTAEKICRAFPEIDIDWLLNREVKEKHVSRFDELSAEAREKRISYGKLQAIRSGMLKV